MMRDLRAIVERGPRTCCNIVASIVNAGGSVAGASIQADAAKHAADVQKQMYDLTRSDLKPYNTAGQTALGTLMGNLGQYTSPVALPGLPSDVALPDMPQQMTEAMLQSTPGYQFVRSQGLKSVQNAAAARGLGASGAALKGAATYATGLADNTYQNQFANQQALFGDRQARFADAFTQGQQQFVNRQQLFNDQWTNQLNPYNMLTGVAGLGEDAAAKTGNVGVNAANGISNALIQGGNAAAGGLVGASSAIGNGLAMNRLLGMYGGGGAGGAGAVPGSDIGDFTGLF